MRGCMALWAALSACVSLAALADTAAPPPIEHFTRFDEFGAIKLSPDGQFVAMSAGRSVIAFIDLKGKKVSGVRAPDPWEIFDFYWVSPRRVIYQIAERYPGYETPFYTGELFGIDRDGGNHRQIYGYRTGGKEIGSRLKGTEKTYGQADLISTLRGDDDYILVAERRWKSLGFAMSTYWDAPPRITKLHVYSGDKRELGIAPLRAAWILVDQNDQVRFAFGVNDEFKPAVSWKPEPDAPWTQFDLPGFREDGVLPLRFTGDNRGVMFIGVPEGETHSALYRLDLATRAVQKVHQFENAEVTDVVTDFAGKEIIGVEGYGERPVRHWLDPGNRAAKVYAALERAFAGQSVSITGTSDDGKVALVFVRSDVNPGEYYLFDTQTMHAEFLRAARAWIDPRQMRPRKPIEVTARDGLKLHGYLTEAAGEGAHPLVVLPHGGPHGIRDRWEFDWEAQLLASRGYSVLQINFRGSGGYGMDFEQAGYRQWGAKMQDDVTDATRWAIEQGITQPDKICIYGASYGGFAALMGVAREPDLYRCAIGYAGIYDLELMYSSGDVPDYRLGQTYLAKVLGENAGDLRARSPVAYVANIKAPVLLIHGTKDWRADYEQAMRMKEALEKHGKAFEWMSLAREGHGAFNEDTRKQVYERILAFLDKHLKAGQTGAPVSPQ